MAVSDVNQLQMVVSSSTTSFNELIDSQKELIQSQIEHLHNLVVAQCKLTDVNPLSQEMAAGALSIKIGKRPRDLLNPKAMKYMQSFFSIKDATNKRESREISALFGVTATQVREFFNGQRSRVRRFVRLSGEKANRSNKCAEQEGPLCSDPNLPSNTLPLNTLAPISTEGDPNLPSNTLPLNTLAPISTEGPSCSTQDEDIPPGMNDLDKHFVENIFTLMRKEDKFSGQVKLMEWILQIQESTVLQWFLKKGGVMILATWLGQAALEEQTTVLHVIIKVLCHLPLHKALPAHMSAILQSVNKLRFYRSSDISNRARVLLSKWSKIFARSQNLKKPNAVKSTSECQDEMLLKQSIGEIMGSELRERETKADNLDPAIKGYSGTENLRKLDSSQPVKLLTSSVDDSNKKLVRGSSSHTRERRKVQLVEQPGQKVTGRSSQLARPLPASQERPLSADEIQKAKQRAQFMQSKYGKPVTTSDGSPKKVPHPQVNMSQATSSSHVRAKVEEHKKPTTNESELAPVINKVNQEVYEPVSKKIKRAQISWQTPPEMRINSDWMVGTGINSKEVEFQRNRIRREKEIIYKTIHEIPSDPKEPWDREIDYDDSLTPEIPIEQLPDAEGTENTVSRGQSEEVGVTSAATTSQSSSGNGNVNGNMPEPDFELLAVLLKNPDLVFALTSAEGGGNLSSQDTMKLLDMLKSNGVSSAVGSLAEEKIEVSLPSPTPSSNPVTSAWGAVAKNPFSWQPATVYGEDNHMSAVTATVQSHVYSTGMVVSQRPVIAPSPAEPIVTQTPMYQRAISAAFPENRARVAVPSLNQTAPEILHNQNNFTVSNLAQHNSLAAPLAMPHLMPTSARSEMRQPSEDIPEPQFSTASWRDRQNLTPNSEYYTNYNNNYNAYAGGTQQAPMGHLRNRSEMIGDLRYDTWSPDNSPVRSQQSGWSYGQPRTNNGQNYRVDRSRQQLQPRHPEYRDHGRNDDRRWRDQRR